MKKIITLGAVLALVCSCGTGDRGELLGGVEGKRWSTTKPHGMSLVPGGTFTMGQSNEDFLGAQDAPTKTVTVGSFYMDETAVTNNQYRKFVDWVKDSVIRTRLAIAADDMGLTPDGGGIGAYAFLDNEENLDRMTPYQRYMYENYYSMDSSDDMYAGRRLNKKVNLPVSVDRYPDEYYVEVMDSLYIPASETYNGLGMFDASKIKFKYTYVDLEGAMKDKGVDPRGKRSRHLKTETLLIYPDTTRWIKEFQYSYNEPMHNDYFWHEAFGEYPVVGVNWNQARAFAAWRTLYKNTFLRSKRLPSEVHEYRLPMESEWEFAARGGLEGAMYPWGGPYTTDEKGCFMANFKPSRFDYAADGATYTAEARAYPPNGYNLYNMSGNVAEWTSSPYDSSSYDFMSSLKPKNRRSDTPLKVVRGGSWRDPAYMLQVATRDSEYADSARSYIGFRTVQSVSGSMSRSNASKMAR
ncbi:gliding motility lipoprotein GldK [Myroides odoratus]|jgi:gliding motility-associated lipoprotein GldK|uniref:Serine/threonine-protein kinase pkn1 n=1 Tax=Myroides odoratus TaxID=256 RepID=A0A378U0X5_MYROD|nr:gliding motility lipoprotein GldK [Myroides odoratus]MDH6602692.1 sulfatase modifying factor 1 [Myroides gitamensis]MCS4238869.1 gliding motility-associated lipoprotein GldK [Myroides odoratus]MDR0224356.1 gliding motility lipoprotein GldK [Myroides odoratus]QQU03804.1 gliding motility lipoprotein GldK [Myroides odoratus]STZ68915.1 Serine/threonine-protein kinase pkn1 [Myroides odoratus]